MTSVYILLHNSASGFKKMLSCKSVSFGCVKHQRECPGMTEFIFSAIPLQVVSASQWLKMKIQQIENHATSNMFKIFPDLYQPQVTLSSRQRQWTCLKACQSDTSTLKLMKLNPYFFKFIFCTSVAVHACSSFGKEDFMDICSGS